MWRRATIFKPLRSKRAMISPLSERAKASGFTRISVRSMTSFAGSLGSGGGPRAAGPAGSPAGAAAGRLGGGDGSGRLLSVLDLLARERIVELGQLILDRGRRAVAPAPRARACQPRDV